MTTTSETSRSRWSVVAAFMVVGAATQVTWLTYAPVTTVAAERFGVSATAVGWLANVFPLLYVLLAVPAGVALDHWFRPALATGAVLTAAGAALRLVDDSYLWALLGQTVIAVAQPLVLNAITGVAGRYLDDRDRPTGIALGTASTFAGMVTAFALGAVLPGAGHLQTLVGVSAGISVLAAALMVVALRSPSTQRHAAPLAWSHALRAALGARLVRRICLAVFLPFGMFVALTTYGQALLAPAGVSGATASLMLLCAVVAAVVGSAVIPVWATRRRTELTAIGVALVLSGLACAALGLAPGVVVGFVALTTFGLVLPPAMPILLTLVERGTDEAEGTAAGLVWMTGNLGGLVVTATVGLLVDTPVVAFAVCAAAVLLATPFLRLLRDDFAATRAR